MARRARKRRPGAAPSHPPRPGAPVVRDAGAPDSHAPTNGGATTDRGAPTDPSATTNRGGVLASGRSSMSRGYARAREKDEAARAALVPLAPGERPWPIALSAVLAAVFAVANVILVLAGWEVDGRRPIASGLIFAAVMVAAAVGMWRLKYWAVLGWEVLLGVTFIGAMLSLLRAGNAAGVALSVIVMALTGPLFWLLIRQMARIQMPKRK
ncbi:MAG TPA: hypothetical protein VI006_11280 [Solirubrobacteraceae bacterium]